MCASWEVLDNHCSGCAGLTSPEIPCGRASGARLVKSLEQGVNDILEQLLVGSLLRACCLGSWMLPQMPHIDLHMNSVLC